MSKEHEKTAKAEHQTRTKAADDTPQKETRDQIVRELIAYITSRMETFMNYEDVENTLTGTQRRRLISAGVRNYGFIDKAFDIARDNPEFMPPHFNVHALIEEMHNLEDIRQLMLLLQQFEQIVTDAFMTQADACYRDALRIYGSLREQTHNRVPGAEPLFEALRTFFRRRRRDTGEPTEMELERDFKRLVHGTADGEIIIQNETPQIAEGVHKIVDTVHTDRSAFKETLDASVANGIGVHEGTVEHKK